MSISISCKECGRPIVCEAGKVAIGFFLTCGACGHSFECGSRELRAALRNLEKRIKESPQQNLDREFEKDLPILN